MKILLVALLFISDVQINQFSGYPDSVAAIVSNRIADHVVYDCGDLVEHGAICEESEYATYSDLFPNSRPVPGNHDCYDGLVGWMWPVPPVDLWDEGAHIVGFDSNSWNDPVALEDLWTRLDDGVQFTILYMHHPIFSDNVRNGRLADTLRPSFLPKLLELGVDLVVAGHGHAYEHHVYQGLNCLVIGGAGAPLDLVGTSSTQVMSSSEHHWLEIDVSMRSCTVTGLQGNVIETFTLPQLVDIQDSSWGEIKALYR